MANEVRAQSDEGQECIYSLNPDRRELRQAEIFSNLAQYSVKFLNDGSAEVVETIHPFAVMVTQDCDLLRDFEQLGSGEPATLNEVLFFEARTAQEMQDVLPRGRELRKTIFQNNNERYHYLQQVPPQLDSERNGLPDLIIDFRRYFSVSSSEVYRQLGRADGAKRRCLVMPPYREHLQTRAAFYLQRVTLPVPHQSPD